jgi:hypothetical protein
MILGVSIVNDLTEVIKGGIGLCKCGVFGIQEQ